MTGLFHTSTTSAPLVFEAAGMQCTKASVGSMDNNAYLLDAGGPLLLIDAPDEAERLLALLDGRPLAAVVTTTGIPTTCRPWPKGSADRGDRLRRRP